MNKFPAWREYFHGDITTGIAKRKIVILTD
jgi:hypothetical protein